MKCTLILPAIVIGLSCSGHASHRPVHRDATSVPSLAYEIERTTRSLQRETQYSTSRRDRQGKKLIQELKRLEERAREFRRTVERSYWEDRRSRKDFDKLVRQYYRTQETTQYTYAPRQVFGIAKRAPKTDLSLFFQ